MASQASARTESAEIDRHKRLAHLVQLGISLPLLLVILVVEGATASTRGPAVVQHTCNGARLGTASRSMMPSRLWTAVHIDWARPGLLKISSQMASTSLQVPGSITISRRAAWAGRRAAIGRIPPRTTHLRELPTPPPPPTPPGAQQRRLRPTGRSSTTWLDRPPSRRLVIGSVPVLAQEDRGVGAGNKWVDLRRPGTLPAG